MSEDKADRTADAIIENLADRSGFDWWWEGIDEITQEEIRVTLARIIRDTQ